MSDAVSAGTSPAAASPAAPAPVPLGPGPFVAVVGASGVGKDALLAAARARSGPDAQFPRRAITRPPGPGEDFDAVGDEEFAAAAARGDYAVTWRAHGLSYGIPATADDAVRAGAAVVANVSRSMLDVLQARYARLVVVRITVSEDVRAARLRERGREAADDIARRLARQDPAPDRVADHEVRNHGTVAEGGEALLRAIRAARASALAGSAPAASPLPHPIDPAPRGRTETP
ncbi:Ribose 1,5-bisphosphate phosphokinase PhnN [Clavibacter michiganensis subsp. michiganensis]|uniref:phosphonate metabolism protein/1,5-bisphosphokinase (PRPP-forming) PhnN n=2 Tax=Clavibacter michiganensis TaxID=28447 RepID=UPI000B734FB2|nr:phosphonate metabolism protein/1,5-bisphosphokinase (PRPP-forming) PhnN [Clavibacter michiganensis]OUD98594.1 Ribose 1,5-bisphosphate phosphokinase PhnN [Clavibacter michiganensis subsp. michiganensis]